MSETTMRAGGDRLAEAKRLLLEKRLRGEAKPLGPRETIGRAAEPGPAYPMSYQQEQLWFLDRLEPGSPYYNIPGANLISARVDVPTLERALTEVVRRHQAMRTVFRLVDGKPMQIVQPPYDLHIAVEEMRGPHGEPAPDEAVRRKASEWGALPFDLENGPLFAAKLFRVSDDDSLLVFNIHHIVTDGWAMPIVTREMEEIYTALGRGEPSPLPELRIQYADYSVWQRGHLSGPTLRKLTDFWKGHLEGAPTTLELPTDRPRPAQASHRGAIHRFVFPGTLLEALRGVGRQEHASVNMVFMAGFNLLLQRYSGEDDLVVGTLLGNRNRAELEPLVGYFVNSGAIRTRLHGDPTFREVVRQVRSSILDADAHQELPFDMVVDALKVPRDPGRNPLFQVMYFHHTFVGSHHLDDEEGLAGALNLRSLYQEAEAVLVDVGTAKFDQMWATLEIGGAMPGMVEYATDLFDAATIARMAAHLQALLADACARPDLPVSRLRMLAEGDRRALERFNATAADLPFEAVHRRFERRAHASPDAPALTHQGRTLTCAALNARANRIARRLRALGAGPERVVGVCLERTPDLVATLLAVSKAGAAYVPLDPAHPALRTRALLEDTRAPVVVATAARAAEVAPEGCRALRLDADAAEVEAEDGSDLGIDVEPASLAYVLFTSGSTGTPKGVEVEHGALSNLLGWMRGEISPAERECVLGSTSTSFDVSVAELFDTLCNGGRLVLVDGALDLAGLAEAGEVRMAAMVPTAAAELLRQGALPPGLGTLNLGGEALPVALVDALGAAGTVRTIRNLYGPTEATVYSTVSVCVPGAGKPTIGRPVPNTRGHVLDAAGAPVPPGVPGELYIAGAQVGRGYLGRPALTAERYLPDPFSPVPGARMYRTGDRVRWLANGELEYFGRLDQQVKVRGHRIEPGEVEAVLRAHPAVREAAVAVHGDGAERKLVGYLVPAGPEPTAEEMRAWLGERLPEYMVPAVFVALESLPLSQSGKLDRRALPAPDAGRLQAAAGYAPPRTEAEAALAAIWAEVLGVERVGVHDNFFVLGGDSIVSIQIVARANQAGLRMQPRHVFSHQTVAELASIAGRAEAAVAEQEAVTGPVPLTPVQRWFLAQPQPEPEHFNLTLLFRAAGRIDADALERACAAVLAHHDALRLRFTRGADGWEQAGAAPDDGPALDRVDLSAVPAEGREAAFTARAAQVQRGLELARGPLVRFALFDFGAGAPERLLIVAHHLVVDAVSWSFVARDLETAYAQAARGEEVQFPRKTTSFREWARRLALHADAGEVRRQAPFWLRQAGVPPLPVDGDPAANLEGDARRFGVELDEETTRALLTEVPPVYGTEINHVLLAALARAFRGWTGERALRVELEGHGREDLFDGVDLTRTAGWFTAIYPLRLELSAGGAPGEDLVAVKEQLRAVPAKGVGYGLLRWLSADPEIPRELALHPAPQVVFNYLGRMDFGGSDPGAPWTGMEADVGAQRSPAGPRTHLLAVDAAVIEGRLSVTWTYGRRVHHAATVECLAAAFADELRALVAHCRDPRAGGPTPSDFDLAGLDQGGLDALMAQIGVG
jgi:amino acid adenylation domain-containing protein/non-ribosomal peptide synthase protein (TIGR01720 family)